MLNNDYTSPIPQGLHWDEWVADDKGITGDELLNQSHTRLVKLCRPHGVKLRQSYARKGP